MARGVDYVPPNNKAKEGSQAEINNHNMHYHLSQNIIFSLFETVALQPAVPT